MERTQARQERRKEARNQEVLKTHSPLLILLQAGTHSMKTLRVRNKMTPFEED